MAAKEEGVQVTVDEAQQVIDAIFEMYPGLAPFFDGCKRRASRERWLCDAFGRFRRFHNTTDRMVLGEQERQAMNFPIQGTIADAVTRAVDHLYYGRAKYNVDYKLALQIHDAVLLQVPVEFVPKVIDTVLPECMVKKVPIYPAALNGMPLGTGPYYLGVDIEIYQYWGEQLMPDQCERIGFDPKYAGWIQEGSGFIHLHDPGKIFKDGRLQKVEV